ncbi:MAG: mercuric transporter MerT family protein [Pyrinomonadaceae bacterium]
MFKEKAVIAGAVSAGLLASLCCIGPLLFVLFGVGAFGAATYFDKARPFLMGGSILLLAVAFYWVYFKRTKEPCEPGEACAVKPLSRASRIGLWIASVAVLAFAALPYFAGPLAAKIDEKRTIGEQPINEECCVADISGDTTTITPAAGMDVVTFKVEGMTCVSCEVTINLALNRTRGVRSAVVSYDRGEAVVEYDPQKTTRDKLREAINRTGYTVKE